MCSCLTSTFQPPCCWRNSSVRWFSLPFLDIQLIALFWGDLSAFLCKIPLYVPPRSGDRLLFLVCTHWNPLLRSSHKTWFRTSSSYKSVWDSRNSAKQCVIQFLLYLFNAQNKHKVPFRRWLSTTPSSTQSIFFCTTREMGIYPIVSIAALICHENCCQTERG